MKSGKLIAAILAGAATGALLGILFAPDKGHQTRKKISKKGSDFTDTVKKGMDDFSGSLSKKYENLKGSVTNSVQGKVDIVKNEVASMNTDANTFS